MKKRIFFIFSIITLVSCGDGSLPSFKYEGNTRIIIEAILVNEDGSVLANQSLKLFSFNRNDRIVIKQVFSDVQGKIFLSAPKGNNLMFIEFDNKHIISTTSHFDLIHSPSFQNLSWFGFLNESYYDIGITVLKEIE